MSARVTDREREVRALLEKQASSGESLAGFARSVGVPAGTLSWWKRELRRRDRARVAGVEPCGASASQPAWLAVEVVDEDDRGNGADAASAAAPLVVRVGERLAVEVPADADSDQLTRVVKALLSC